MIVNRQYPIVFTNQCGCEFDEETLRKAIIWWSDKPVCRNKKVFISERYPAVSIHEQKVHIHRLIYSYCHQGKLLSNDIIHHVDGNRLNASIENLKKQNPKQHIHHHLLGKKQSPEHIKKRIRSTVKTRSGHDIYKNPELLNTENSSAIDANTEGKE